MSNPLTDETVRRHVTSLEGALGTVEASRSQLYQPDGATPVYEASEQARREAALLEAFDQAHQQVMAAAQQEATAIERAELELEQDPLDRLSTADLARAGQLAPFISEDVESATLADLGQRVRLALSLGDQVRLTLLHRAMARRLSQMDQARERNGGTAPPALVEERERLATLVEELRRAVTPADVAEKRRELAQRRERVRGLQRTAGEVAARAHQTEQRQRRELLLTGRYGSII